MNILALSDFALPLNDFQRTQALIPILGNNMVSFRGWGEHSPCIALPWKIFSSESIQVFQNLKAT